MRLKIPFNCPTVVGDEFLHMMEAVKQLQLSGNGEYTKRCQAWLKNETSANRGFLTQSCTAALEMSALLIDIQPGDEVIMPSYTFVSTANAFVLRGATPVFVDIRPDTLNLDEKLVEEAVTPKTRAIVPVHYAGVACEMDTIIMIASKYPNLFVIEDAAQGVLSTYKGHALGSIGHLGTYSFHETKNISAGEGGALLVNHSSFEDRAEILWEKGTNRNKMFRGEIDKYSWCDKGSSFLPSELTAAFLWGQLEKAHLIIERRRNAWNYYHILLEELEIKGLLRRPVIPEECEHNGHLYYILLSQELNRDEVISFLKNCGIGALFHYIPLHNSPAGQRFGRPHGKLSITEMISDQVVRLPLWFGLSSEDQHRVVEALSRAIISGRK